MRSTNEIQWSEWYSFDSEPTVAPNSPGVYEVRTDFAFGRLRGQSPIVYIGKTARGLRRRLFNERRGDPVRYMSGAEKLLYQAGHRLEFRYAVTAGREVAEQFEAHELMKYVREHWELPPGNGKMPRKDLQG